MYKFYENKSVGVEIGPVYRASFRAQMGNGIESFFRRLFRFVKPRLYSGVKNLEKETLKSGCNIITDIAKATGTACG